MERSDEAWLSRRFEEHRPRLRAVAYRMLGSTGEADDALQEAWLRYARSDTRAVEDLGAWLTTVVARVCLNLLRARRTRREDEREVVHVPDPVVGAAAGDPEHEALLADSVGLALLVVLETLPPAERLAFVLHDVFAVPFGEIAAMLERSPEATRQLASRARRRVRAAAPVPDAALPAQREVVDAFFAAARAGDVDALVAVLHPDVVIRADGAPSPVAGAEQVAGRALLFADPAREVVPVTVNGAAGVVVLLGGRPVSVMGFTVTGGRVAAIDALGDPDRLGRLDLRAAGR